MMIDFLEEELIAYVWEEWCLWALLYKVSNLAQRKFDPNERFDINIIPPIAIKTPEVKKEEIKLVTKTTSVMEAVFANSKACLTAGKLKSSLTIGTCIDSSKNLDNAILVGHGNIGKMYDGRVFLITCTHVIAKPNLILYNPDTGRSYNTKQEDYTCLNDCAFIELASNKDYQNLMSCLSLQAVLIAPLNFNTAVALKYMEINALPIQSYVTMGMHIPDYRKDTSPRGLTGFGYTSGPGNSGAGIFQGGYMVGVHSGSSNAGDASLATVLTAFCEPGKFRKGLKLPPVDLNDEEMLEVITKAKLESSVASDAKLDKNYESFDAVYVHFLNPKNRRGKFEFDDWHYEWNDIAETAYMSREQRDLDELKADLDFILEQGFTTKSREYHSAAMEHRRKLIKRYGKSSQNESSEGVLVNLEDFQKVGEQPTVNQVPVPQALAGMFTKSILESSEEKIESLTMKEKTPTETPILETPKETPKEPKKKKMVTLVTRERTPEMEAQFQSAKAAALLNPGPPTNMSDIIEMKNLLMKYSTETIVLREKLEALEVKYQDQQTSLQTKIQELTEARQAILLVQQEKNRFKESEKELRSRLEILQIASSSQKKTESQKPNPPLISSKKLAPVGQETGEKKSRPRKESGNSSPGSSQQ